MHNYFFFFWEGAGIVCSPKKKTVCSARLIFSCACVNVSPSMAVEN